MKFMIGVGHPKHVHIWKNVIKNLINDGHEVKIVAREKDITLNLLDAYGFDYEVVGKNYKGIIKKALGLIQTDLKLYKIVKKFNPDLLLYGTPYLAQVSKLFNKPHIMLLDTEHANFAYWLSYPFTNKVLTPACFSKHIDTKKQVTFDGYFELAYLHPNYFKPDATILKELELDEKDTFFIIRFVSWQASHDISQHGFTNDKEMIDILSRYGRVFITSERKLSPNLEKYRISVPPERMHDLLYFATMYIGEGAAMASECAILGTPAIYVNTQKLGYLDEQETKYGLIYNILNPINAQKDALSKALELLKDDNLKKRWQEKRQKMLIEKIDVTKFITEFVENYPRNRTK